MNWEQKFQNKLTLGHAIQPNTLNKYWKHFCHEYDMATFPSENREMLQVKIGPQNLAFLALEVEKMCQNSSLKKEFTLQGKVAEYAFAYAVNSLFNFFNLKKRIDINVDSYIYGGDGGGDFFIGDKIIDIKYRDEAPNRGLYLDKSFLEQAKDTNILVHCTNSISIKVHNLFSYQNQTMLVALNGWTTVEEFRKNCDKSGDRWRMDKGFLPIKNLLIALLKDQQAFESLG